jgi:hypothetical protein
MFINTIFSGYQGRKLVEIKSGTISVVKQQRDIKKGKVVPLRSTEAVEGEEVQLLLS